MRFTLRSINQAHALTRGQLVLQLARADVRGTGNGFNGMNGWTKEELISVWLSAYGEFEVDEFADDYVGLLSR